MAVFVLVLLLVTWYRDEILSRIDRFRQRVGREHRLALCNRPDQDAVRRSHAHFPLGPGEGTGDRLYEVLTVPAPSRTRPIWGRIAPTLVILGIMAASALILLPPMYYVGKRSDDERIFLRNYRAPNEYEAWTSFCMDYAIKSDEPNDVIFVGDSTLRYDLQTIQFKRETGLKAYNLGNVGLIAVSGFTQVIASYLSSRHPKPR